MVFAFLEESGNCLEQFLSALSKQHLKNLYLYVAGSVFILERILIARGITTVGESTAVG